MRGGEREGRGPVVGGTEQRCPLPTVGDPAPTPAEGAGRPEPSARGGVRTPGVTAPGRGGGCEGGGGRAQRTTPEGALSPRGSLTAGLAGVPALGQTRPQTGRQVRSPPGQERPSGTEPHDWGAPLPSRCHGLSGHPGIVTPPSSRLSGCTPEPPPRPQPWPEPASS